MQGFRVVTLDDEELGVVVNETDDYWVFETGGRFRKTQHAVPRQYTEVEADAERVRTTLAKELVEDSPKIEGELDEQVVGEYYGLREPAHRRDADDAGSAEEEGLRAGIISANEERAKIRQGHLDSGGFRTGSPGMLGDRLADTDPPKH